MSEYNEHIRRKGKGYEPMHEAMYKVVVELLRNKPADILEVGFGIGYGLDLLREANCIKHYTGVEPDKQCAEHVLEKSGYDDQKITLFQEDWMDIEDISLGECDFSLCIEVVEHMPKDMVLPALRKMRKFTKEAIFLSTPDSSKFDHGRLTNDATIAALRLAGFKEIVAIEWQLPHTLFIGTP